MPQTTRRVQPPPGRQQGSPEEVWPSIEREARRQLDSFYPVLDREASKRVLFVLQQGIFSMWTRGAARMREDGSVEFWNPHEGVYQDYDENYNQLMLELLRSTLQRADAA